MNNNILAGYKKLLSYTKSTWNLNDYPLHYRHQGELTHNIQPWIVQIINWWSMSGTGNTKEEAYQMLETHFKSYQEANETMPRPGSHVPLQYADTSAIDTLEPIAVDFFDKIMGYNYYECFISDESSLVDFGLDTPEVLQQINQTYGLQLTEIGNGNLVRILKCIQALKQGKAVHQFKIFKLLDHHNRGQVIFAQQLDFKNLLDIKEGSLLNGIRVYHYLEMYPLKDEQGNPLFDRYILRPVLERYPEGHFQVGQIVELIIPL